jgi:hypothetical protein
VDIGLVGGPDVGSMKAPVCGPGFAPVVSWRYTSPSVKRSPGALGGPVGVGFPARAGHSASVIPSTRRKRTPAPASFFREVMDVLLSARLDLHRTEFALRLRAQQVARREGSIASPIRAS